MRAKNKLSPYPVLRDYADDYKSGEFGAKINVLDNGSGYLRIDVEYLLNESYLESLINENKACYALHIECPETSFRKTFNGIRSYESQTIDTSIITGTIEINTFIISNESLHLSSINFNDAYKGISFEIDKGAILAIGKSIKVEVSNNTKSLEDFPSLIKICKSGKLNKSFVVDTDSDYIKIKLDDDVYNSYKELGNSLLVKTCFSLILFPAIISVIIRMVEDANGDEELIERKWYMALEKKLKSKEIDLKDLHFSDDSILDACQKIFDDPVRKALEELINKIGAVNDED